MDVYACRAVPALCLLILTLGGCAVIQPLPNAARTGDTLVVGIGATESDLILHTDTARVTVTDAAGSSATVRLRRLFRLYPDPTSPYARRAGARWSGSDRPIETYASPYQGQWVAVVDLLDPTTEVPPPLATGTATLQFTSATLNRAVRVEILPGTGSPNPLDGEYHLVNYAAAATLEPMPQVVARVQGTPSGPVGGAAFVFQYTSADFQDEYKAPHAVVTSPDPDLALLSSRRDLGGGLTELTVVLLDPHGFSPDDTIVPGFASGRALLRDLRVILVWDKSLTAITDANWGMSLHLIRATYYDLGGAPMPELTAALVKVH